MIAGAHMRARERQGLLLCAASAAGFGAMAIFAKLAYEAGAGVAELLAVRFTLAAAVLAAVVALRKPAAGPRLTRRTVLLCAALGAVVYAPEAGLYFAALTRLDVSVAGLVLYVYPAIVVAGAVLLRREHASRRTWLALTLATVGVAGVLLGSGGAGPIDPVGVALALAAAVAYAGYVLTASQVGRRVDPVVLSALVCFGSAVSFAVIAAGTGEFRLSLEPVGWLWIAALAVISTVVPLAAFLAGAERLGAGRASIVSTLEPPITVGLAMLVFGERLAAGQLAGGALVLLAVVVLQARGVRSRGRDAAPEASAQAAAGALGASAA